MNPLRVALQFAVIAALFAAVAALSDWPVYRQIPEGKGVITMTFVHGADRKAECRRLTPQVLQSLVDDRLKRQEARRQKVSVSRQEMDKALLSVAQQLRVPPNQLADHLAQRGAKISTLIDQIETDIAWLRTVSKIAGYEALPYDQKKKLLARAAALVRRQWDEA